MAAARTRTPARPTTAWVKLLLRARRAINDIELRKKRGEDRDNMEPAADVVCAAFDITDKQ